MSNNDGRPDFDDVVDEQAMAEAMASLQGCGSEGLAIPMGHPKVGKMPPGHPPIPAGHPPVHKMPAGHPPIDKIPPGHPPMTGAKPPGHPEVGEMPAGHPKIGAMPASHRPTQRHGGARSVGFRPGGGPEAVAFQERTGIQAPRIIAWEITRSCNLNCVHCRAASRYGTYEGELTLDEIKGVVDNIATITNPIVILTGGEPLLRDDIWDIIDYCHEKGAMPVVGTNATLITPEIAQKLADHGIPRISVSIDFPTAKDHDEFRVMPGSFEQSVAGIKNAKAAGVGVQINTTVTKYNADKLEEIHTLAEELNVDAFHIFMLVPTGRASDLAEQELSPERYEEVLIWAYHRQKTSSLHFKPTDAPHYYRIIRQLAHAEGREVTVEEYGLDAMTRGCLGGITFCFISHIGDVQPCGYFDMQLGNVKERPYAEIWETSPVFNDLRDYSKLKGKCGACEFRGVCGGCRARALEATGGDYLAEEPYCSYVPPGFKPDGEDTKA